MFCPSCSAEYVDGVRQCPDCLADLVEELPPSPPAEYREFEELLQTYNPVDVALIRSMLDGSGIDYYFNGEFFNNFEQMVLPARLCVRKDQAADARELLKDFEVRFMVPHKTEE